MNKTLIPDEKRFTGMICSDRIHKLGSDGRSGASIRSDRSKMKMNAFSL